MKTKRTRSTGAIFLALTLLGCSQISAEPTAFSLIKEGNKYVGEQAKDKVVEIRSERSVGGLVPNIWYVVYYDSTATLKATEVKLGAGKMLDVKRPPRVLEPVFGQDQPLDSSKLKVDSDKALATAQAEPLLEKLTLKASQMTLSRVDGVPTWKIRFWAARQRDPNDMANIGDVFVSAETGAVTKTDLHPDKTN
jgi:hypothetical protein